MANDFEKAITVNIQQQWRENSGRKNYSPQVLLHNKDCKPYEGNFLFVAEFEKKIEKILFFIFPNLEKLNCKNVLSNVTKLF